MQLDECNPCLQLLTCKSQQNLHQLFLGILRDYSLVTSDIFVLSPCSLPWVLLSWTCWTHHGFPLSLLCLFPLLGVTASAGQSHCSGHTTHPIGLWPPQAASVNSRGTGPPDCYWEVRGKWLFLYSVWGSLREHQSNVIWLISIKDTRNKFSMVKLVVFKMCAWLDLDKDIWNVS